MIEIYYVVALSMGITNTYKKKIYKALIPLLSFITVIVLNIFNALVFDGDMQEAIKEAVIVGGITIGIFNAGDVTGKVINKKPPIT